MFRISFRQGDNLFRALEHTGFVYQTPFVDQMSDFLTTGRSDVRSKSDLRVAKFTDWVSDLQIGQICRSITTYIVCFLIYHIFNFARSI